MIKIIFFCLIILTLIITFFCFKTKESFIQKKNLIIIIPLRDREEHLKKYLDKMKPIFKKQNISYKIFIIEQSNKKKFNKGKLNNIAKEHAVGGLGVYKNFVHIASGPLRRWSS